MAGFNLDDYVTVNERIEQFYARHPDGSLQAEVFELSESRVVIRAYAYRSPDDKQPAIAHSALAIPGSTPYTKGSEIENAETSAIGRAIAFLGFEVKKSVASRDEIEGKRGPQRIDRATGKSVDAPSRNRDGSLPGIAMIGRKSTSDGELRVTPEGHRLGFRLEAREGDKGGILVEVNDPLASAMAMLREDWLDQPVTCWGTIGDREFTTGSGEKRRTITFQVLALSRIETPTIVLPAEDELDKVFESVAPTDHDVAQ